MSFAKPAPLPLPSHNFLANTTEISIDIGGNILPIFGGHEDNYPGPSLSVHEYHEPPVSPGTKHKKVSCLNCKNSKKACAGVGTCDRCLQRRKNCVYPPPRSGPTDGRTSPSTLPTTDQQQSLDKFSSLIHVNPVTSPAIDTSEMDYQPQPVDAFSYMIFPEEDLSLLKPVAQDQVDLILYYYDYTTDYYPAPLCRATMINEYIDCLIGRHTLLSPFFFMALCSLALAIPGFRQCIELSSVYLQSCINQAPTILRSQRRISTVFAVLLLVHSHMMNPQADLVEPVTQLARGAFELLIYLHKHRTYSNDAYDLFFERTFWYAFVMDKHMVMFYGVPISLEESIFHSKIGNVEPLTSFIPEDIGDKSHRWVKQLRKMVVFCRIMGRIFRYNYGPQPLRHTVTESPPDNGYLTTIDTWIMDEFKKAGIGLKQLGEGQMIDLSYLLDSLMLLHRPYINLTRSVGRGLPCLASLDICFNAAKMFLVPFLALPSLAQKTQPPVLHTFVISLRVYSLMADQNRLQTSDINTFDRGLKCLQDIVASQGNSSLKNVLDTLLVQAKHVIHLSPHSTSFSTVPVAQS